MTTSFLVPVYNREDMLRDTLDSIIAQTEPNWEAIVVETGSTDKTWDTCQEYAMLDSRIRVFHEDINLGFLPAVLRCVWEAKGFYGKFVYSDDAIKPEYLARTLPHMEEDVGFVYTPAIIGHELWQGRVDYSIPAGKHPSFEFIQGSLRGGPEYPVSPGCAIFRLSDIARFQLHYEVHLSTAGTDLLLLMRTANAYPYFAHVAEPLAWFRHHPGSTTIAHPDAVAEGYAYARKWWNQGNR